MPSGLLDTPSWPRPFVAPMPTAVTPLPRFDTMLPRAVVVAELPPGSGVRPIWLPNAETVCPVDETTLPAF